MKLFWVRHGKTEQNELNKYYGKLDARLTPQGVEEVRSILTAFDGCSNVYTSPASRAVETAGILFKTIYFQPDARLNERHMGVFEGLSDYEIRKHYPKEREAWYSDWQNYILPEGESAQMQYERVVSFIKEMEAKNEDAVIVCHAGTIRMALCYMLGGQMEMFWKFKIDTGIVITTVYEHDYWYMEFARKYY